MKRGYIFLLIALFSCSSKEHNYSFYYWRTEFSLDSIEQVALKQSQSKTIYTRFFDIDKTNQQFYPVGKISFSDVNIEQKITPVVFITNRSFYRIRGEEIRSLAENTHLLIQKIKEQHQVNTTDEIQIDCDWTSQTREDYFQFLKELKKISKKNISCTLRLHQVKDKKDAGIPPVEKVYLMCYATSSPLENKNKNSILDVSTLKHYLKNIEDYPLKIDVALPLYSWGVVSNHLNEKRLINGLTTQGLSQNSKFKKISDTEFEIQEDGFYFGMYLNRGFKIKIEEISQRQLDEVKRFLDKKIEGYDVVYYHLDSKFVKNYRL